MAIITGRTALGSEPAALRELAERAWQETRIRMLRVLLAIGVLGQSILTGIAATVPPLTVFVEILP